VLYDYDFLKCEKHDNWNGIFYDRKSKAVLSSKLNRQVTIWLLRKSGGKLWQSSVKSAEEITMNKNQYLRKVKSYMALLKN